LSKIGVLVHIFPKTNFWERCPAENYANLVTQFVSVLEKNEQDCKFQQYGATANTAKATEAWLSRCRASLLAATISRSYATSPFSFFLFSMWHFLIKESTAITQGAQRTFNIALNRLLPAPITNS